MPGPLDPNSQQAIMSQILGNPQLLSQANMPGMGGGGPGGAASGQIQSMMNTAAPTPAQLAAQQLAQQQQQQALSGQSGTPTGAAMLQASQPVSTTPAAPITTSPTINSYGLGQ